MTIEYQYIYNKETNKLEKTPILFLTDKDYFRSIEINSPNYGYHKEGKKYAPPPIITISFEPNEVNIDEEAWAALTKQLEKNNDKL